MGCSRTYTKEDHAHVLATNEIRRIRESIDNTKLEKAVSIYQQYALDDLISVYYQSPEYVNAIIDCLNTIADANIDGVEEIIYDLSQGGTKASGAEFMLHFVSKHKDEITAVEVPTVKYQTNQTIHLTSGIDIMKKDGAVVELKNYNFHSSYYRDNPDSAAKSVAKQALDRIENFGISNVEIVFSSWNGDMPVEFRDSLIRAIGNNEHIKFRVE